MGCAPSRTVSFDVGGVIDSAPEKFSMLMADLRRRGVRVVVVTALQYRASVGVRDIATLVAFSHGLLYGMGLRVGEHYDACYAVPELHSGPLTGMSKSAILKCEQPAMHVDDDASVASGITSCPVFLYSGDLLALSRAIDAALEAQRP